MTHAIIMTIIAILIGIAATAIGLSMSYVHNDHMSIAKQHIADLEKLLSNLIDAKAEIDTAIVSTTHRLLDAHAQLDTKNLCRAQANKASRIDSDFQNIGPHAY